MRRLYLVVFALLVASPAWAATDRSLSARLRIDGYTNDFTEDEAVFGLNAALGEPEESVDDSRWGVNDDINQIRITWDAKYLYLAGEGRIWDNNMILFLDCVPRQGLGSTDSLNSWRRNFAFDTSGLGRGEGFAPDLFCATWDGNTSPRLIMQERGQVVRDLQLTDGFFSAAATFDKGNADRAMEFALPWSTVFLGPVGIGTRDTLMTVGGVTDTFQVFPAGARLRICGVVTAGADGTGGPDSAPDNTRGHTGNAGDLVYLDNWATIDLDRNDDTGRGAGGPDGVADWGVEPRSRVSFRIQPPITSSVSRTLRFALRDVALDRPAFRPDLGERLHFKVELQPSPDPSNPFHQISSLDFTANVFDLRGRFIRNLYIRQSRKLLEVQSEALYREADSWDGRDQQGQRVPPGIYVLRTVIEPNLSRAMRSFVVVR